MRGRLTVLLCAALGFGCGDDGDPAAADGSPVDAATIDADVPDAFVADAAPTDPDYQTLADTGFYSDPGTLTIDPALIEYVSKYPLWSDAALKRRWVLLPAGQKIDTTDMDNWRFPVGTKFFKEFGYQPEGGGDPVIVEVRLIERIRPGDGGDAWWRGSFAFLNAAGTPQTPTLVNLGDQTIPAANLVGRDIDYRIPDDDQCQACHDGTSHRVLGFQAIQLSHNDTVNVDWLNDNGYLTTTPAIGGYPIPGNATEQEALGYLHGNCSHCHGPPELRSVASVCYDSTGATSPLVIPNMAFRVRTTDVLVTDTLAYQAAVSVTTKTAVGSIPALRIDPGEISTSAVYYRMSVRGNSEQMPPLFDGYTDVVNPTGLAAVEAWINSL